MYTELNKRPRKIVQLPVEPYEDDLDPQCNCPECDTLCDWSRQYFQFHCLRCEIVFDEEQFYGF